MTLQDIMDMPKEKQILIENILNGELTNCDVIKYCVDKKYIRYSTEDNKRVVWDAIKIFQLPIEEMKSLADMINKK